MRLIRLIAVLLLPSLLRADNEAVPLHVAFISEMRTISAGETFCLGLHLLPPPGSHTYWKNPGIVGLATTVEWELPPGFSAGEIQWPAPQTVMMANRKAQGYAGETLLIIPITPPKNLTSPTATLTAKVSWMCCGTICQPAVRIPFSITLPVGNQADPDPDTRSRFEKSRSRRAATFSPVTARWIPMNRNRSKFSPEAASG